jgi:hypothetical protein
MTAKPNRILLHFLRPPIRSNAAALAQQQPRAAAVPARSFALGFGPPQTFIAPRLRRPDETLISQRLLPRAIAARPASGTTTGRLTDYARLVSAPIRLAESNPSDTGARQAGRDPQDQNAVRRTSLK